MDGELGDEAGARWKARKNEQLGRARKKAKNCRPTSIGGTNGSVATEGTAENPLASERTVFDFLNGGAMKTVAAESCSSGSKQNTCTANSVSNIASLTAAQRMLRLSCIEKREQTLRESQVRCKEGIVRNDTKSGSSSLLQQLKVKLGDIESELRSLADERLALSDTKQLKSKTKASGKLHGSGVEKNFLF
jgi:hypothetical protein